MQNQMMPMGQMDMSSMFSGGLYNSGATIPQAQQQMGNSVQNCPCRRVTLASNVSCSSMTVAAWPVC
jgi:hypothetical protein